MTRHLAAVACSAVLAFAQGTATSRVSAKQRVVDAIAVDGEGHPVTGLVAGDFEIEQGGGKRPIEAFAFLDTVRHVALSSTGLSNPLEMRPDEIHRDLVFVVDDLGLSSAGALAVRNALGKVLSESMATGDRMAIVRASGGSMRDQQLTSDRRLLSRSIGGIQYFGNSLSAQAAGRATWLALRQALDGLRDFPGRKTLVILSERPEMAAPGGLAAIEAIQAASAAGAAIYAVHALGAAVASNPAMNEFVRATSGETGLSLSQVLERECGYYTLAIAEAGYQLDPAANRFPPAPTAIRIRKPGVTLRARAGYLARLDRRETPFLFGSAPLSVPPLRSSYSPFAAGEIPVRLTALFTDFAPPAYHINLILHLDAQSVSLLHSMGRHRGEIRLQFGAQRDDGRSIPAFTRSMPFNLSESEYKLVVEDGFRFAFPVLLPEPGEWMCTVVVQDGSNDGIGGAAQFLHVPRVDRGDLSLSSLVLRRSSAAAGDKTPDLLGDPGVRIFKGGDTCELTYGLFNPTYGEDGKAHVEGQVRLLAAGRPVYEGRFQPLTIVKSGSGGAPRLVNSLRLEPNIAPGDYIVQVTARDLLAPEGTPRTAAQYADFAVR
jgi:VWFA-related protein